MSVGQDAAEGQALADGLQDLGAAQGGAALGGATLGIAAPGDLVLLVQDQAQLAGVDPVAHDDLPVHRLDVGRGRGEPQDHDVVLLVPLAADAGDLAGHAGGKHERQDGAIRPALVRGHHGVGVGSRGRDGLRERHARRGGLPAGLGEGRGRCQGYPPW